MKKIRIEDINEDVYFEKLENGLEIYMLNKDTFHSSYVTFTTKYGSIYNEFIPISSNKMTSFPKGIAHFLEHKVFAVKEGPDPMEFFARSGAVCNAYTTFNNTTYLFYATDKLKENIAYLLDYVQDLYLTEESVEKEKKIISEEIHMYDDMPSEVLSEKIRYNSLNNNPYRDSIIGTKKDISKITKKDLETCYQTFYHPSNMFLVVVGSFNPEEILNEIKENQKNKKFSKANEIKIKELTEDDKVSKKEEIISSPTNIPKASLTIKMPTKNIKLSRRKLSLYLYILFSSMFDETSDFDENLKKDKIITSTTYVTTLNCNTHILISLINETPKYNEFLGRVKEYLKNISITKEDFERKKKVLISNEILAFDDIENINDIIMDDIIYEGKIETNPVEVIKSLNINELNELIKKINIKNSSQIILKK